MALWDNTHKPTDHLKQRVSDMTQAGLPKYLIAKILKMDEETLCKHYEYELATAQGELVDKIAKAVAVQAQNGDQKSQALYLKTQGAKFGWVEKQVIETKSADETQELKDKVKELEAKHERDY